MGEHHYAIFCTVYISSLVNETNLEKNLEKENKKTQKRS